MSPFPPISTIATFLPFLPATVLAANVDPELYDSLATLVADAAGQQDNEEDAAYWEAVYLALIQ